MKELTRRVERLRRIVEALKRLARCRYAAEVELALLELKKVMK